MNGHDIIVVGASAGGVEALTNLVRGLPRELPASVFIVLHIAAQSPSILPEILTRAGNLPATHAVDGERIEHGRIYVAPPDQHLLIEEGYVHVVRGPRENRHRPAVDPMFRSAALAYGTRVVGIVLTGALDDGTAGMRSLKSRGGVSVIQDPQEAIYPSMPRSVERNVKVDYCLPLAEIPPLIVRLASEAADAGEYPVPDDLKTEVKIAEQTMNTTEFIESVEKLGTRSLFTCPECHGLLWEMNDGELLRFRCHVGHAFSIESLMAEQSEVLENALWSALRSLEEKVALARNMAQRAWERNYAKAARKFEERAQEAEQQAQSVRNLLLSGRGLTPDTLVDETAGAD